MEKDVIVIEDEIRARFASVVWSHKIQEKQADIYDKRYRIMETINIVCASLTSAGIISLIFTDPLWLKMATAILSFVIVFVGAYKKSFDLSLCSKAHRETAVKLLSIRDEMEMLLMKLHMEQSDHCGVVEQFLGIMGRLHSIYEEAPSTTDKAVEKASIALKTTKDNTFAEEEIDSFLPESLRRGRRDGT